MRAQALDLNEIAERLAVILHPASISRLAMAEFDPKRLYPEELAAVENAVKRRKAEFATVRILARDALAELGERASSLHPYDDRSPRWPEGIVGSLSHCDGLCLAVVARSADIGSIGVDIEDIGAVRFGLEKNICSDAERTWLRMLSGEAKNTYRAVIFSAKEAFFKCQYPLANAKFDFLDLELSLDPKAHSFTVNFTGKPFLPEIRLLGLSGRFAIVGRFVITIAVLESPMRMW